MTLLKGYNKNDRFYRIIFYHAIFGRVPKQQKKKKRKKKQKKRTYTYANFMRRVINVEQNVEKGVP